MLILLKSAYMNDGRIGSKFRELRLRREGALITYLTGADPTPETFCSNAQALVEGGADILEIGVPFSDPIADGPVIQASSHRAIERGATPSGILQQASRLSKTIDIPIVLLTYYNPVLAKGLDQFMKTAELSGVNGIVIPDLPAEESDQLSLAAEKYHVDTIFLASPNTTPARIKTILEKSRGFLYLVSLFGVTGPRRELSKTAVDAVTKIKRLSKNAIPVAAGFGISMPEQISALIQAGADGAIVGSVLVEIVNENLENPEATRVRLLETVSNLKKATRARVA
jgi:tryptophan synthase alpha chain